jgi:hypothetical protein
MKRNIWRLSGMRSSILATTLVLFSVSVQAGTVVYDFTNVISGTTGPALPAPWVSAVFEDTAPGTVRLSVTNVGLSGVESESFLFFNLRPALDPTGLNFSFVNQSGSFVLPTISKSANQYRADGDGYFDIQLAFSQGGQSDRFVAGEALVYDISGIAGLAASDFAYMSYDGGGAGQYYAAAHIQQISDPLQPSAWIGASQTTAVPEPTALALVGLGVGALLARRRL